MEYIEDPVVPLERHLYGHPLAGLLWERQFEKAVKELGWEKVSNWECSFVHRKQKLFFSVYVDDIKMAGKKQNLSPMWKKLMKDLDIEEPTSPLDRAYLGCTQRECKPNEKIIGQYNKCLKSRISAGATEKKPRWDKPRAKTSAWSYDIEGHARKCVEQPFQDSDFAGDPEDSKSTSGGVLCIFWNSNICTDQLDVQEANVSVSQLHRIRDRIVG